MGRTGSRSFVSDILVVWGSALFLLATVQPFLILSKWMPPDPYGMPRIIDFLQADFYSFKVDYDVNIHPWSTSFSDYWFHSGSWLHAHSVSPVPHILVAIFVLQISTPVLGFITLPMKPRTRFIPLISCTVAAFLMTWLYLTLYTDGMYQRWSLASGYWLTYASILCFSTSIILFVFCKPPDPHEAFSGVQYVRRSSCSMAKTHCIVCHPEPLSTDRLQLSSIGLGELGT